MCYTARMLVYFVNAAVWNPKVAAVVASLLVGDPGVAEPLMRVCQRESRCQAIGVHAVDAGLPAYWGQVKLGHLDPSCQQYQPGQWATRGAFGLSASSHWEYLPRCFQPWWLDVPLISAWVAAQKYVRRCTGPSRKRRSWCPIRKRRTNVLHIVRRLLA